MGKQTEPRPAAAGPDDNAASREKTAVAGLSAAAATVLTLGKLAVGILTGSIAILSEAAHSALDLLTSLITFFAVRVAARPPDEEHPYGHHKAENIAAYTETLFLLATCTAISLEALKRLLHFHGESVVKLNGWAYGMVGLSIAIDWWRSTALLRAAKKHSSHALEADALHFRADLWSSCVVLAGLTIMGLGRRFAPGLAGILDHADSVAALGVVVLVLNATFHLGHRTVEVLLDGAPEDLRVSIREAVAEVEDVLGIREMRARQVGSKTFVELDLAVCRTSSFETSHAVTREVAERIREVLPSADVVVHAHPTQCDHETVASRIRALAEGERINVHHLIVHEARGRFYVDLDVEVEQDLTLGAAHKLVSGFERLIRADQPQVAQINSRIEPRPEAMADSRDITASAETVVEAVRRVATSVECVEGCHNITVRTQAERLFISVHCVCAPGVPVGAAHRAASRIEEDLHAALPALERVLVHMEPPRGRND